MGRKTEKKEGVRRQHEKKKKKTVGCGEKQKNNVWKEKKVVWGEKRGCGEKQEKKGCGEKKQKKKREGWVEKPGKKKGVVI